ncbi:DUF7344 domain-containing protein [Halopiger djelfimassiliensis]|uniref:DUF7344 domain-containing protein n=1 Tax=Halopiger djelfimassiliensis TaxID=1293047 RepID=UPI00067813E7|nr:hypothetical protein [Halopiger djelfimassiliensis]
MTIHSDRPQPGFQRPIPRGDAPSGGLPLSRADLRHVLDSDRRQAVIRRLLDADGPTRVHTLVGRLADDEDDATVVTTILELRQRIHVSLCRTHLPVLESYGIVAYDRERGVVSPGVTLSAIEVALEDESDD